MANRNFIKSSSYSRITKKIKLEYAEILSEEALEFVAQLHHKFDARRKELLVVQVISFG